MSQLLQCCWHAIMHCIQHTLVIGGLLDGQSPCVCRRDAIMQQHSYEMPAASIQYSICDNLLLVFNEAGAVLVIDVDATANTIVSGPQSFLIAQPGVTFHIAPSMH